MAPRRAISYIRSFDLPPDEAASLIECDVRGRSCVQAAELLHLSVDGLAGRFYLSRYYLMHRFKAVTGYSLHQYITQKRLLWAGELLRQGTPVMKAAELAGFRDYSTFLRAFQSTFHVSPRKFLQGPPPAPVRDID